MDRKFTRSEALKSLIVLPALAAAIVPEIAEAKGSKAQFKYQSTPKGDQMCSNCQFFIPGKTPTAMGQCKVVEGSISPKGWCTAYSKKA
ncbi:MAG: high-potential iron-sulfur protein [Vulcanimicrobiaceae bacterium]